MGILVFCVRNMIALPPAKCYTYTARQHPPVGKQLNLFSSPHSPPGFAGGNIR